MPDKAGIKSCRFARESMCFICACKDVVNYTAGIVFTFIKQT